MKLELNERFIGVIRLQKSVDIFSAYAYVRFQRATNNKEMK